MPTSSSPTQGRVITIVGCTASGKTALAMELARRYQAIILCADSRTIYREMDIGTAKPTDEERREIEHYGLNLISPSEQYSAYQFQRYAQQIIRDATQKNRNIIMVGGSGMYIDAVLFDYHFRDKTVSNEDFSDLSHDELVKRAQEQYPVEMSLIDVKNTRRIRQLLDRGPSNVTDRYSLKLNTLVLGKSVKTLQLKENIAIRTHAMLSQGFVQEVKQLRERYGEACPGLSVTGYRRVNEYLNGEIELEDLESLINADTWQLARKQRTWFRRNSHICWFEDDAELIACAADYLMESSVK
ncbi:MAG: tRNA (adenosine(37)-N6)-dimethylallyltransferase MiaA [Candidatus Saccharibacteria bacterium]